MSFNVDSLNEQKKQELLKTVSGGRRPHAVLVDGGTEKEREEIAYLLAKIYVCENALDSTPCNSCSGCRKTDEKIHPDIIRVTKDPDRKYYRKNEDVRPIVEDAYQTPNEAKVRVIIIPEMQLMKVESQNVLLKILEEPPTYTAFILTSESANNVIGTVLSRVSRFRIGESDNDLVFKEKTLEIVKNISEALSSNYEFDIISATAPLDGNKQRIVEVLTALSVFFRDALAIKNGSKSLLKDLEQEAEKVAFSFPVSTLLNYYESTNELLKLTQGNPNYNLLVAQLCVNLRNK
jgi:DNA polymerase III gamma/tau subunit